MFEKIIRAIALTMFIGSALFLALSALVAGCALGGAAGWASMSLLHVLAPRYFAVGNWEVALMGAGAVAGGLGTLFVLGRWMVEALRQSDDPALRGFARRIERIWRVTST